MFEDLVPGSVAVVEASGNATTGDDTFLYPEEEAVVARAVDKRRREFATVRACARQAMEKLGVPGRPILPGERGAPRWPDGLIGSMTHCDGYCAAALARAGELVSLGIDAEPHDRLPDGVLDAISLPAERARLRGLARSHPSVHWDRLLFSAKESVYKAWFPLTGRWLDFHEADIELLPGDAPDAGDGSGISAGGTLRARLLVPGPVVAGRRVEVFEGRWAARHGLAATSVVVPQG
ncbi:4'-phosphopantetheinyl transferase family protein [Streptomyces nodosus]|uniref:4'-phosphopantetheinyl transferase n=1 Tax=Streptomyces nodosus TaxID=40318 RepID=A0A0B5DIE6_9ACTN|nr:4'-phosphopantetheinyl transferase superfamily protein [Streptomyces nodosus]AJE43493.1 4'-phosphopantetheinyl transferase [Streptomyces nodosus]MBB4794962.1 4'-phosphopantetheinyl transferase EntD [Streptomyces nodosus]QEV41998.1 4'-phosphopantetheinyl transferase superfamily protein [Streptomyces nodosus]